MAGHVVLLEGELFCGNKPHQVQICEEGMFWQSGKKAADGAEIKWCDIFAVTSQGDQKFFTLHYISRRKDKKWRAAEKKFEVKSGEITAWVSQIQAKYRPSTPKRMLVIVNPIGGSGSGRQVYEKKAAPLFQLAGISTDVVITERAKHAVEIMNAYDLSKIDSITAVGGDGIYMEVVDTLLTRLHKDAGIDINERSAPVNPIENFRIGLIPAGKGSVQSHLGPTRKQTRVLGSCGDAGTGNGIANMACNVIDQETSILHVIKGEVHNFNVFTVHDSEKLLCYSALLFGYGICSELIQKTEEKRWMKKFRYPYCMLGTAFGKARVFEAEMYYQALSGASTSSNTPTEEQSPEGAAASTASGNSQEWKKIDQKGMVDVMMFVANYVFDAEGNLSFDPYGDCVSVMLSHDCGGMKYMKNLFSLMLKKGDLEDGPNLTILKNVTAFRIKIKTSHDEATSAKAQRMKEREHIFDIDGESLLVDNVDIEARLHPRIIPLFASLPESPNVSPKT